MHEEEEENELLHEILDEEKEKVLLILTIWAFASKSFVIAIKPIKDGK